MNTRTASQRSIPDESEEIANAARASSVRWQVLAIVIAIMAVTALNRLNLSIAGKSIEDEFSFNTIAMGLAFSAFMWAYALFQLPWGYICDRIGPRRTLTAAILIFSVGAGAVALAPAFAALTGVSILTAFRLVRFFTGIGEAAISSNVTRVIASWTALRERGFASGLQVCGLGIGGMLTPVFIAWTMTHWGWRASFVVCSLLGLATVAVWHAYATDWPEQHARVNNAELQLIHPGSTKGVIPTQSSTAVEWVKILGSVSVWGLILGYGFQGYAFYVYYNWFYFYAVKMRGLGIMQAALWTSLPFLAVAILSPLGGWFSDRLMGTMSRRKARLSAVCLGMGVSAVLLFAGNRMSVTDVALPTIALASGFNMFAGANFWAACIDLAPRHSAFLSALMNTMSAIGGAISSTLTASIAVHHGWKNALDLAALITVGSGLLFALANTNRPIETEY